MLLLFREQPFIEGNAQGLKVLFHPNRLLLFREQPFIEGGIK